MRMPFRTEADAFRVAVALASLLAISMLIGWLASRPYGIVLFAAGIAAGLTFELVGPAADRRSALLEAAHAPHPHGSVGGRRHILVVALETLAGEELYDALTMTGPSNLELDVLAPVMTSRSHYWTSDVDREHTDAQHRLEASLAWAAERGLTAKGEVGDSDPLAAIEDELRTFGADEVIIATHPRERISWLANRMIGHLERELDVPVREIAVADEHDHGRSASPASED
jgi:hypothetical protein